MPDDHKNFGGPLVLDFRTSRKNDWICINKLEQMYRAKINITHAKRPKQLSGKKNIFHSKRAKYPEIKTLIKPGYLIFTKRLSTSHNHIENNCINKYFFHFILLSLKL